MSKHQKPPKGVRETTALIRKLVKVPKAEVDALESKKAKRKKK